MDVLKKEFSKKQDKDIEEIVDLEKKKKALDNTVYKTGQTVQTMHMLTKPQVFSDESHKITLGYQYPLYLTQAQRKQHALYYGHTIVGKHDAFSVIDTEETLKLPKERIFEFCFKNYGLLMEEAVDGHIICQDIMCIAMHADFKHNCVLPTHATNLEYDQMEQSFINECSRCLELEAELSKKKDMVEMDVYNKLQNDL
ncbi:hypothetical protein Tco_0359072 [Tanacetum coccineum]